MDELEKSWTLIQQICGQYRGTLQEHQLIQQAINKVNMAIRKANEQPNEKGGKNIPDG